MIYQLLFLKDLFEALLNTVETAWSIFAMQVVLDLVFMDVYSCTDTHMEWYLRNSYANCINLL